MNPSHKVTMYSHYCLAGFIALTCNLKSNKTYCFYFLLLDLGSVTTRFYATSALWHQPEFCGFTNIVGLVPGNENAPVDFLSPSGPVSYEPSSSKPDDQPSTVSSILL